MVENQQGKGLEQEKRNAPEQTNIAWQGEHPFFVQDSGGAGSNKNDATEPKPEQLKTGDQLLIASGKQVLTTPNGERLEVTTGAMNFAAHMYAQDGKLLGSKYVETIASEPPIEIMRQEDGARLEVQPGVTKIIYPNDDKIVFDQSGICSVTRAGVSVEFHQPHYPTLRPVQNRKPQVI